MLEMKKWQRKLSFMPCPVFEKSLYIFFLNVSCSQAFFFLFRNAAECSTCTTHKLHSSVWGPIWKFYTAQRDSPIGEVAG